ncbi:hypothetical protein KUCAC02_001524 [Chaenocephalus aceratus]|uniref:Uncharacterized protein n=1 Tax=Chaenocephalus aceratus TaxID=36190 RepID=A0ACB9XT67_CHAAC|nr:hypothetical protein KUCAC02_001524 [Chaenocephalus aceratus]
MALSCPPHEDQRAPVKFKVSAASDHEHTREDTDRSTCCLQASLSVGSSPVKNTRNSIHKITEKTEAVTFEKVDQRRSEDGQCQTGDMDMDAAIKVRKEPQGKAEVGPGQRAKDRYPMRQMRARTSAMEIID